MITSGGLEKCFSYINSQLKEPAGPLALSGRRKLAVTISRQAGSGALGVAVKLAEILQAQTPPETCAWTVFDRNLVERVLGDHNLPSKLAEYMPEDRRSLIDDIMEELLGLHPASWTLVHQTTETILRLAELGSVIIVGRGANVITSKLDHVFHVRLIGSPDKRVARLQQNLVIDEEAAREFLDNEDRGRKRYLETYFHADIEDPLLYDLVINTDRHPTEFVARLIAQAVLALA